MTVKYEITNIVLLVSYGPVIRQPGSFGSILRLRNELNWIELSKIIHHGNGNF